MVHTTSAIAVAALALSVATFAAPVEFTEGVTARDFDDFEVDARDLIEFDLDARDYDDFELDSRDFEVEDFEARDFEDFEERDWYDEEVLMERATKAKSALRKKLSSSNGAPAGGGGRGVNAKIDDTQAQIDSTTGVLRENISKVAEHGENSDSLQSKTENLAVSAQGFRRGANREKKKKKNAKSSASGTSKKRKRSYEILDELD